MDPGYLKALEGMHDAVEQIMTSGLRIQHLVELDKTLKSVDARQPFQDKFRTDAEIGPRSLKRFEARLR